MHIRCFDVASDLPLGDMSGSNPSVLPTGSDGKVVEIDVPEAEKEKFEEWLRSVWREKDILIAKFLETGSFVDDPQTQVEIPVALRRKRECLNAYTFFGHSLIIWILANFR